MNKKISAISAFCAAVSMISFCSCTHSQAQKTAPVEKKVHRAVKGIKTSLSNPVPGEKIIFSENFNSPEALSKWRISTAADGPQFRIENGALSVEHRHKPNFGSFIEMRIPLIKKGRIDFDVLIDPERKDPRDRIGLTLDIFNISTFWHDSCNDWRMYFPEPEIKRLPYFFIEPVGHKKIAAVPKYKYVHYRIVFDHDADLVEFYVDDLKDPKSARYDVSIMGHAYYQGAFLRIGSYGYTQNSYRTLVDNIVVTEMSERADSIRKKDEILVFDGLLTTYLPMKRVLKGAKFRVYHWDSPVYNVSNTNNYQYMKMPGFQTVKNAKTIIFNDAPNVPEALQKKILDSVKEGADLIIFSGLCSLGKGEFKDTPIGRALPVILTDEWAIAGHSEKPIRLDAKPGLVPKDGAVMYYYWDLKPAEGAEILATADNGKIPVLIRKKFGKGTVTVLAATVCGPAGKDCFWKTAFVDNIRNFLKTRQTE